MFVSDIHNCPQRTCTWFGQFAASDGSETGKYATLAPGGPVISGPNVVVPAVDAGSRDTVYPVGGGTAWRAPAAGSAAALAAVLVLLATEIAVPPYRAHRRRRRALADRQAGSLTGHYPLARARVVGTYRGTFSAFAWTAWALFLVFMGGVFLASPKGLGAQAFLVALVISAVEVIFLQLARCGVTIQGDGLIVRQPVSRVELPWRQIRDVQVDGAGALVISLVSGAEVSVFGFGGSLIGVVTGGVHAKRARNGILAARPARYAAGRARTAVTSRIALSWPWILGTLFALELAALVGILAH